MRRLRNLPDVTLFVLLFAGGGCATSTAGAGRTSSAATAAAPPAGITYAGGDGHDCASRVIIRGAAGELDGVGAEYDWLAHKYPGYKRRMQSLTKCDGQPADKLGVETADGQSVDVTFDISDFFGKGI
jgi:hypothetical protein